MARGGDAEAEVCRERELVWLRPHGEDPAGLRNGSGWRAGIWEAAGGVGPHHNGPLTRSSRRYRKLLEDPSHIFVKIFLSAVRRMGQGAMGGGGSS